MPKGEFLIMNNTLKRVLSVAAALILLVSVFACSKSDPANNGSEQNKDYTPGPVIDPDATAVATVGPAVIDNVVKVTFTVDARAAYGSGELPEEVKAQLVGEGLLMNNAQITLPRGSKLTSTFRVLDISGIPVVYENGLVTCLKGVANGSCGENSRWILKINGEIVEGNLEGIELSNGDEILFLYDLEAGPAPSFEVSSTESPSSDPAGRH